MLMSLTGCALPAGSLRVVDLRCEDKLSPMGIDVSRPFLSWRLESARRGVMQSRISRASGQRSGGPERLSERTLWDSGERQRRPERQSGICGTHRSVPDSHRILEGFGPRSDQGNESASERGQCGRWGCFSLRIGEPNGSTSRPAQGQMPASVPTAPATTQSTQPDPPDQPHVYPPNLPPYLRKDFRYRKTGRPRQALCDGAGVVRMLGQRATGRRRGAGAGLDELSSSRPVSDIGCHRRICAAADNVVAALLGDGWYCGNVGLDRRACRTDRGRRFWRNWSSIIRMARARSSHPMIPGGRRLGRSGDPISRMVKITTPAWKFQAGTRRILTIPPGNWSRFDGKIRRWKRRSRRRCGKHMRWPRRRSRSRRPGKYVFDFGQNMVGFARLRAAAPAGTKSRSGSRRC
jgi:hypothetical protein